MDEKQILEENKILFMSEIIKYFTIKYKGEWEKIYHSITAKEYPDPKKVSKTKTEVLKQMESVGIHNPSYISIISENYPNNFKKIYMPPLSLFLFGNNQLLQKSDNIVSLWGDIVDEQIKADKKNIYAISFKNENFKKIKNLNDKDISLILVDDNSLTEAKADFLKKELKSKNFCYVSEFSPLSEANFSADQNQKRLLLGVSKKSLVFGKKLEQADERIHFEENRPFQLVNNNTKSKTISKKENEIEEVKQKLMSKKTSGSSQNQGGQ